MLPPSSLEDSTHITLHVLLVIVLIVTDLFKAICALNVLNILIDGINIFHFNVVYGAFDEYHRS